LEGKIDNLLKLVGKTAENVFKMNENITSLQSGESLLRLENSRLKREVEELKNEIRQKNVVIYGLEERDRNEEELTEIILRMLNEGMGVRILQEDMDGVTRLGRYNHQKIRPILVALTTMKAKKAIMRSRRNLKGTKIYIEEDLTVETRAREKALKPLMIEKRKEGYHVVIRRGKLLVENLECTEEAASFLEEFIKKKKAEREEMWRKRERAKNRNNGHK